MLVSRTAICPYHHTLQLSHSTEVCQQPPASRAGNIRSAILSTNCCDLHQYSCPHHHLTLEPCSLPSDYRVKNEAAETVMKVWQSRLASLHAHGQPKLMPHLPPSPHQRTQVAVKHQAVCRQPQNRLWAQIKTSLFGYHCCQSRRVLVAQCWAVRELQLRQKGSVGAC